MATSRELVNADGAPRADAPANSETQHTMAVGDDFLGNLADPDDHDWIRIELRPGTSYVIRLHGHGEVPVNDPLLELYDADGEQVAFNDDLYQGVLHSQIVFTTPGSGQGEDAPLVYYINARSYSLNPALASDGDYRLSLSEQQPLSAPDTPPGAPDALLNPETVIIGYSVRDNLTGDEADNVLEGRGDADTLDGGGQPADGLGDSASYRRAGSGVNVNLRTGRGEDGEAEGDTLVNIENLIGSDHDDTLTGDNNDNILLGGPGDDTLAGDGGADLLIGGEGTDTASYYRNFSNHGVRVDLAAGVADGSTAEGDRLAGIENLIGTTQDDKLYGDDGDNRLWGYRGNDLLSGRGGADVFVFYHNDNHDTVLDFDPDQDTLELHLYPKHGSDWQELNIKADGEDTVIRIDQDNSLTLKGVAVSDLDDKNFTLVVETPPARAASDASDASGGGGHDSAAPPVDEVRTGTKGDDTITTGAGNDTLDGGEGNDTLNGGDGNDTLIGGPGKDTLDGGPGNDTARYEDRDSGSSASMSAGAIAASNTGIIIDLGGTQDTYGYVTGKGGDADGDKLKGIENLWGSPGDDTLTGDDNANTLWGRGGDDTLKGKGGDDTIIGGTGADTIDGGSGNDFAVYTESSKGVEIDLSTTKSGYSIGKGGDAEGDKLKNIEFLVGSAHDDTLTGDDLTGDDNFNILFGFGGDDTLQGKGGDDLIIGGAGADKIDGGAGNDWAYYTASSKGVEIDLSTTKSGYSIGKGGDAEGDKLKNIESLYGSNHGDTLTGDNNRNSLSGSAGADTLNGMGGPDTLEGGPGADTLDGGAGDYDLADYVHSSAAVTIDLSTTDGKGYSTGTGGEAGGDKLKNIEYLRGSMHNDTLTGDANENRLWGYSGNDKLSGGGGKDEIYGEAGDDTLEGDAGDDTLEGGDGNDTLTGGAGDDTLEGGTGNDTLEGGDDDDTLTGGGGYDVFVFSSGDGSDTIKDFSTTDDRIDLTSFKLSGINDSKLDIDQSGSDAVIKINNDVTITLTGITTTLVDNDFIFKSGLIGTPGNDTLTGGAGDDIIDGRGGNDKLQGKGGNDTLIGGTGNDNLDGDDGNDKLEGGAGKDDLDGGAGDDALYGGAGNDTLKGKDGDDALFGGGGADTLDGGAGVGDHAYYYASDAAVTIDLSTTKSGYSAGKGGDAEGDKLKNIESLVGSAHDDTLTGDGNSNNLSGEAGDDTLNGMGGSDTLFGGSGADTLDGGAGIDNANYSTSSAAVTIDLSGTKQNGYITGKGGDAKDDKLKNIESLMGSAHDDTLTGDGNSNILWGLAGKDTLTGKSGNDTLVGGSGADTLDGGAGWDYAYYGQSGSAITIDLSTTKNGYSIGKSGDAEGDKLKNIEAISGSAHGDTLTGDDNNNALLGLDGKDTLNGKGGGDTLVGGPGADTLDGGGGTYDYADYTQSSAAVTIDLGGKQDSNGYVTGKGGDAEGDKLKNIESLWGSSYADTLAGDDNANTLDGYSGNDTLTGGKSADRLIGGPGADTLDGGAGSDEAYYAQSGAAITINLGGKQDGNGYVTGKGGDAAGDKLKNIEELYGSAYDDTLTGDDNANTLIGGGGNDTLAGGKANDRLYGHAGNDTLTGGAGNDILYGNQDNDTLTGGEGDDELGHPISWEAGNDKLTGGGGNDTLYGGTGADTLDGGAGSDTAWYYGSTGVTIDLGGTKDSNGYVTGKGGEAEGDKLKNIENLWGSDGSDTLTGDSNNNVLKGNSGDDTLTGGGGNDTFVFIDPSPFSSGSISDTITDFSTSGDKIDLSDFSLTGFSDSRLTVTTGNTDTVITVDSDVTITLENMTSTLDSGDFIFS